MNLAQTLATCSFAVALLSVVPVAAQSAAPITDLATAVEEGKKTGKPIFVYVYDSV